LSPGNAARKYEVGWQSCDQNIERPTPVPSDFRRSGAMLPFVMANASAVPKVSDHLLIDRRGILFADFINYDENNANRCFY
jgi:hypothetical protein